MSFRDDIRAFVVKVHAREQSIFTGTVDHAHTSIQEGSTVTGAPGQPVDTGVLRASWQKQYESPAVAIISSGGEAAAYNKSIEDGVGPHGPLVLRSPTGGFHSVALTVDNFDRIVEHETRKVVADGR